MYTVLHSGPSSSINDHAVLQYLRHSDAVHDPRLTALHTSLQVVNGKEQQVVGWLSDWLIEQGLTSPPTPYRLYGRRFLQVKRPNQQYQITEGRNSTQTNQTHNKQAAPEPTRGACLLLVQIPLTD